MKKNKNQETQSLSARVGLQEELKKCFIQIFLQSIMRKVVYMKIFQGQKVKGLDKRILFKS